MYLQVLEEVVSATLVQEVNKEERPVYFVSHTLHAAETRYQMIESGTSIGSDRKADATILSKPCHNGKNQLPIYEILYNPDLAGRMIGWSVELSEFDIRYESRGAIKSQCLADFSTELTPQQDVSTEWTLYVDGSSNKTVCDVGVILEGPGDLLIEKTL